MDRINVARGEVKRFVSVAIDLVVCNFYVDSINGSLLIKQHIHLESN